jgi:hypothetical protein
MLSTPKAAMYFSILVMGLTTLAVGCQKKKHKHSDAPAPKSEQEEGWAQIQQSLLDICLSANEANAEAFKPYCTCNAEQTTSIFKAKYPDIATMPEEISLTDEENAKVAQECNAKHPALGTLNPPVDTGSNPPVDTGSDGSDGSDGSGGSEGGGDDGTVVGGDDGTVVTPASFDSALVGEWKLEADGYTFAYKFAADATGNEYVAEGSTVYLDRGLTLTLESAGHLKAVAADGTVQFCLYEISADLLQLGCDESYPADLSNALPLSKVN